MPEAKAGGDTLRRGVVSIGPVKQGARAKRRQPRPTSRRSSAETASSKRLGGHKPEFGAGIGEPRRTCQGGDFTVDNGSAPGRPEVGNAVEAKIEPGLRNPIRRLLRSRCERAAHRLGEECRAATQRQGRNRIRQAHHHQAATDSTQGSQACWDERRAVRLRQVLPAPRPDRPAGPRVLRTGFPPRIRRARSAGPVPDPDRRVFETMCGSLFSANGLLVS